MIILKRGDITEEECDAIVNPANSLGLMGGGVALAIKLKGGEEIEKEAMSKAPIKVGEAIFTKAGKLRCKYVIHSPTMERPVQKIPLKNVKLATTAALNLAKKLKIKSIAFPGMGTGVGEIRAEDAAKVMVEEFKKFKDLEIRLVALDEELYQTFKKCLNENSQ
jgi:O-acetyl-ADP-ribose deacetylase (regulator of RNase III)